MITFKQLPAGTPPDIEVTTDDHQAELAELDELLHGANFEEDLKAAIHLDDAARDDEGNFVFVIPGDEAGEIADIYMPLADFLEECNQRAIERAEGIADAQMERSPADTSMSSDPPTRS